jgi:glycine dehydrogenase
MRTRAEPLGIEVIVGSPRRPRRPRGLRRDLPVPGTHGHLRDFTPQIEALHAAGAIGTSSPTR